MRELNLASANFFGTFGRDGGDGFLVDTETEEEHPSDAVWIVFGTSAGTAASSWHAARSGWSDPARPPAHLARDRNRGSSRSGASRGSQAR